MRDSLVKVVLLSVAAVIVWGVTSFAQPYGSGLYGSCEYGTCSISVSSSGAVNLDLIPSPSGTCTIASDQVGVSTNSTTGYTLKVSSASEETALVSGSDSIVGTNGTVASPQVMTMNSWGFRVDSGNFGAGPTTAQSSGLLPSLTFAQVPALSESAIVVDPSSFRAAPDTTTVWFGVCANTVKPSGVYTGDVTYTAVVNP